MRLYPPSGGGSSSTPREYGTSEASAVSTGYMNLRCSYCRVYVMDDLYFPASTVSR